MYPIRSFSILFLSLLASPFPAVAQCTSGWLATGGSTSARDQAADVAMDSNGNVYVLGGYDGPASFGATTLPGDVEDIFLAKYDPAGLLLWVRGGGSDNVDLPGGLVVDPSGGVVITGTNFRTAVFGTFTLADPADQPNAFVVKYSADGDVLWATALGGSGWDDAYVVARDPVSGHFLVGGSFEGNVSFGPQDLTSAGQGDLYVAELDASGAVLGALHAGGTGDDQARGIAFGPEGTLFISGLFDGTLTVGAQSLVSAGYHDGFVARFDNGNPVWAKRAGGWLDDNFNNAVLTADGQVAVAAVLSGGADVDGTAVDNAGDKDAGLAVFSASDGALEWARTFGGTMTDYAARVQTEISSDHLYLSGVFTGPALFDGLLVDVGGGSHLFVLRCTDAGTMDGLAYWQGPGALYGAGLAQGTDGSLVLCGNVEGTGSIGPYPVTTDQEGGDAFVLRTCADALGVEEPASPERLRLFPMPVAAGASFTIDLSPLERGVTLRLMDAQGRELRTMRTTAPGATWSTEGLASGQYLVVATDRSGRRWPARLVVQ